MNVNNCVKQEWLEREVYIETEMWWLQEKQNGIGNNFSSYLLRSTIRKKDHREPWRQTERRCQVMIPPAVHSFWSHSRVPHLRPFISKQLSACVPLLWGSEGAGADAVAKLAVSGSCHSSWNAADLMLQRTIGDCRLLWHLEPSLHTRHSEIQSSTLKWGISTRLDHAATHPFISHLFLI